MSHETETQPIPGDGLVRQLLESIEELWGHEKRWLAACQAICQARLPPSIYAEIPESVWRFMPWGHRLVARRTPMVDKIGRVIVPDSAKKENCVGWVLTVGTELGVADAKLPDVMPYWDYPLPEDLYKHSKIAPGALQSLLIVGQPVVFGQWTGKALRMSAYDDTHRQLDGGSPLMILSVGDIWGPYLDMKDSEWATEQPSEHIIQ